MRLKHRVSGLEKRVGLNSVGALMQRYGKQAVVACMKRSQACITHRIAWLEGQLKGQIDPPPEPLPEPPPNFWEIMGQWARFELDVKQILAYVQRHAHDDQTPR